MLSLMDPVEFENLVLFRDDEVASKFHVLPDQPVIAENEQGEPEFLFIKYIKDVATVGEGESAGGGYVQFRSTLTIAPERRQRVIEALRARLEQEKAAGKQPLGLTIDTTEPLLAAPLWVDGKVTLLTFQASETGLVRHAPDSRPVDLAGDLGASFALELDDRGAEIFWSAFKNPQQKIPIMISYELKYKARVSAKLEIHAKREVVHRYIWRYARPYVIAQAHMMRYVPIANHTATLTEASLAALSATHRAPVRAMVTRPLIHRAVQEAIQENSIEVKIQTDDAGGADSEIQKMLYTVATEVLSERVIPAMFGEGAAQPGSSSESDSKVAMNLIEVQSGLAGPGDATFDLVLDHQSVIERSVNPNGPLELAIRDETSLNNAFKELRLTDSFFSLMRVTASTSSVDFERDGIDLIKLDFEYSQRDEANSDRPLIERTPDPARDKTLIRSKDDVAHWQFDTARYADGRHKREYRYRTEVHYREGPMRRTEWVTTSARQLLITPHALGALRVELALTAGSAVVESARVALKHVTPGGTTYQAERELTPGGPNPTWLQYTGELSAEDADLNQPEYTYEITYRLPGGKLVMPWTKSTAELLEIPSPFEKTLGFNLRPQGSFEGVASIAGDAVYEDKEHEYEIRRSFTFAALTDEVRLEIPILKGGPETIRWSARINRADGSVDDLGSSEAGPGTVWIGGETDFLEVEILTDLIDFNTDVQLALVTLTYQGANGARPETQTFTFSKEKSVSQIWRVGRGDGGGDSYNVKIRYIAYDRSKSSEVELTGVTDTKLLLDRLS